MTADKFDSTTKPDAIAKQDGDHKLNPSPGKLHDQLHKLLVLSMSGEPCKIQPKDNEVPVMLIGKPTLGCSYKSFDPSGKLPVPGKSNANELKHLDVTSIYNEEKARSVYIESFAKKHGKKDDGSGSGIIVGKRGADELLILTDDHVVGGGLGEKLVRATAETSDGKVREARVVNHDRKHDMALMAVKVDPKEMNDYSVAKVTEGDKQLRHGEEVVTLGFPYDSKSLYAAPGTVRSVHRQDIVLPAERDDIRAGDDPRRLVVDMNMHVIAGTSGGGVYNVKHEVIATLDAKPDGSVRRAMGNPVNRKYIDQLIKHAKDW